MADMPRLPAEPIDQPEHPNPEQRQRSVIFATHSGPLPSIEEIRQWEEVLPGASERFLALLEKQTASEITLDHQEHDLRRDVIRWNFRLLTTGQVFGFTIAMTAILTGAYVILSGQAVAGTVMSSTGIASLVGLFLYNRSRDKKEKVRNDELER